ncbi:MAG: PIN domain-containing protein, partial [Candidatus Methylumidiphilus sp.]
MNRQVIVDTGILVALQNRNDHYHEWAVRKLAHITPPLLTCEAVISETCFLLRDYRKRNV